MVVNAQHLAWIRTRPRTVSCRHRTADSPYDSKHKQPSRLLPPITFGKSRALDDRAHFSFGTAVLLRNINRRPLMVNALVLNEILPPLRCTRRRCHYESCATSGPFASQLAVHSSLPSSASPICTIRTLLSDTRSHRPWRERNVMHRQANASRIRCTSPYKRILQPPGCASSRIRGTALLRDHARLSKEILLVVIDLHTLDSSRTRHRPNRIDVNMSKSLMPITKRSRSRRAHHLVRLPLVRSSRTWSISRYRSFYSLLP